MKKDMVVALLVASVCTALLIGFALGAAYGDCRARGGWLTRGLVCVQEAR